MDMCQHHAYRVTIELTCCKCNEIISIAKYPEYIVPALVLTTTYIKTQIDGFIPALISLNNYRKIFINKIKG